MGLFSVYVTWNPVRPGSQINWACGGAEREEVPAAGGDRCARAQEHGVDQGRLPRAPGGARQEPALRACHRPGAPLLHDDIAAEQLSESATLRFRAVSPHRLTQMPLVAASKQMKLHQHACRSTPHAFQKLHTHVDCFVMWLFVGCRPPTRRVII